MEKELYNRFLKSKKSDCENSRKATIIDLNNFYEFLADKFEGSSELEAIKKVKASDILNWRNYLAEEKRYAVKTINRRLATLRVFSKYLCYIENVIDTPFTRGVSDLKNNKSSKLNGLKTSEETPLITTKQLDELILRTYEVGRNDMEKSRNRFIITFLASTGMRISELINIPVDRPKINDDGELFVDILPEETKTGKGKRVPICGDCKKYYYDYLDKRQDFLMTTLNKKADDKYLILSYRGSRFKQTNAICTMLQRLAEETSIDKIVNHTFRKYFINTGIDAGCSETILKLIGGWEGSDVATKIYVKDTISKDREKIEVVNTILNYGKENKEEEYGKKRQKLKIIRLRAS